MDIHLEDGFDARHESIEHLTGSRKSQQADVLLDANPLEDLSSLASPLGVIQRGKALF